MNDKITCGRRAEDGMANANSPFVGSGVELDYYREDNCCSYCGSLNPDTLMDRIILTEDVELVPTDKNYKVYVENDGGEEFKQSYRNCRTQGVKDCKPDICTHWVTRDMSGTKFYFQHLSEEQKKKFIELLNEKKIKMGYPGHFYSLPFFIKK